MKLWVLPLSIKIHTPWLEIRPTTLRVSGAIWPNKAWRLIWVGDESSIGSMGTGFRVVREVSRDSSSSSTTNKNNPEEHLWPRVNFHHNWNIILFPTVQQVHQVKGVWRDWKEKGVWWGWEVEVSEKQVVEDMGLVVLLWADEVCNGQDDVHRESFLPISRPEKLFGSTMAVARFAPRGGSLGWALRRNNLAKMVQEDR